MSQKSNEFVNAEKLKSSFNEKKKSSSPTVRQQSVEHGSNKSVPNSTKKAEDNQSTSSYYPVLPASLANHPSLFDQCTECSEKLKICQTREKEIKIIQIDIDKNEEQAKRSEDLKKRIGLKKEEFKKLTELREKKRDELKAAQDMEINNKKKSKNLGAMIEKLRMVHETTEALKLETITGQQTYKVLDKKYDDFLIKKSNEANLRKEIVKLNKQTEELDLENLSLEQQLQAMPVSTAVVKPVSTAVKPEENDPEIAAVKEEMVRLSLKIQALEDASRSKQIKKGQE